jgi:tetrahydromethanopterin S-methyltransferase subunit B
MATKIAVEVDVKTKDAAAEIDDLKEQMEELKATTDDLKKKMEGGFKSAEKGAEGASKGVKKFSGSVGNAVKMIGKLSVVLLIFEKLADLLRSNQRITDGLSKAMVTLEVVFGNVAGAVQDLVDGLQGIKDMDMDDIIQKFRDFGNALLNGADGALAQAENIVKMRNELQLAEAQQRKFMLEMQNQAEIQRQIRDNIELDIETRMKANDAIAEILEAQTRGELKISALRISLREAELAINEESIPAQAALIDAQAEQADVLERINGIYSEQKTNAAALRAEEQALAEERSEGREGAFQYMLAIENPWYAGIGAELSAAQDEYFAHLDSMREYLRYNNAEMTEEQIENHEEMIRLEQAYQMKLSRITQKEAEIRKNGQIQAAQATANALGQIAGFLEQQGEEGVAAAKAFALAEVAINTAVAISTAIAGATAAAGSTPSPATPFLQVAYIATMVGAVVAAVAQATQILSSVPGPGGGNVTGGVSAPSAPSVAPVTTNTTELVNAEAAQLAPVQAFVVESQLSGSQENIQQIQNQATFGLTG